jgi:hypothetical protein
LIDSEGEHEVTVTAQVREFHDTGCGACRLAKPANRSQRTSFLWGAAAFLISYTRRARRR